jgi:hypothetical protein
MTRPLDDADALSVIVLGTMTSPGVCTISGHDRPKNWKKKPAKGKTGASMTLEGDDPQDFKVTFQLADDAAVEGADGPSDFQLWDEFERLIRSTTDGPKPFALPIYHPDLARQKITEVTNGGIGGRVHDDKGGASHVVTFTEYKPAKKKATGSPTAKNAGTAGTGAPAKPDPNAAAKAELAALLAEASKP